MKKVKRILLIMIIFLTCILVGSKVKAASANISASKTSVNVGESVTITVNMNAAAWNAKISGATSKSFVGYSDNGENTSKVETVTFTPSAAGTYTITLSGDITDGTTRATTNISGSVTITANATTQTTNNSSSSGTTSGSTSSGSTSGSTSSGSTSGSSNNSGATSSGSSSSSNSENTQTKSSNANLSNLGITPNDFSGFKATTTTYSVTVPNNVTSISVYATAQDSKATITGTGNKELVEGQNEAKIIVTAEDGTTKTYTINITRTKEETTEEEIEEETEIQVKTSETSGEGLAKLQIEGIKSITPEFSTNQYEYEIQLIGEATYLEILTETTNLNYTVEIIGNKDLEEGENYITILVTDEEDGIVATYQLKVEKSLIDYEELAKEEARKKEIQKYILIGAVVVIVFIIIISIIINKKKNGNIDEFEDDENIDEDINENEIDNLKDESINKSYEDEDVIEDYQDMIEKRSKKAKGKRFK